MEPNVYCVTIKVLVTVLLFVIVLIVIIHRYPDIIHSALRKMLHNDYEIK